jgi:hypothetical protein
MHNIITVDFPENIALSLKMNDTEFSKEMKTMAIMKLYELGKISSGLAANTLSISRIDFLELLGKYNISYFDEEFDDDKNIRELF